MVYLFISLYSLIPVTSISSRLTINLSIGNGGTIASALQSPVQSNDSQANRHYHALTHDMVFFSVVLTSGLARLRTFNSAEVLALIRV